MRIKFGIALIAFFVSVASVFSQSDTRAREILKESGQMYKRYKTLSAEFTLTTKSGRRMGHAGAIVGGKDDTAAAKMAIMAECGIHVVESPAEIGQRMYDVLK